MSPTRINGDGTAFDKLLVGAAKREAPLEGAADRALLALGRRPTLAPAPVAIAATSLRGLGHSSTTATTLRWIALATVVVGAGVALLGRGQPPRVGTLPEVVSVPPAEPLAVAPGALASAVAEPAVVPEPIAPAPAQGARSHALPPRATTPAASITRVGGAPCTLAAEVALVQEATQALARQDGAAAAKTLDAYAGRCSHGALAEEAGFLRVRTLLAQGKPDAARDLAQTLLDANPHGVLAPKLSVVVHDR